MPRSLNQDRKIVLIAHNIRSTHNVGSLFRTAEGLGVKELILSGYTPYPRLKDDKRLEHITAKLDKQIDKTALGAQSSLKWRVIEDIQAEISKLQDGGYKVYALEQHPASQNVFDLALDDKVAVIVGNEVTGIEDNVLRLCNQIIEIPMFGKKESFNVVQAAAMAISYLRFY